MKKGFTLIELLAVIVILAIIALIATPIVLNIIEETKESATLRSAEYYLSAVENSIAKKSLSIGGNFSPSVCEVQSDGNLLCDGTDELEIEVNGEKPSRGTIMFDEGKIVDVELTLGNNTVSKDEKGAFVLGELQEKPICALVEGEANTIGSKYQCKVKDDMEDGYYFYVLSLNDDGTTNLIMDQNINSDGTLAGTTGVTKSGENVYNLVEWNNERNGSGPIVPMQFLYNATKTWTNVEPINYTYNDREVQGGNFGYTSFVSLDGILTITGTTTTIIGTEEVPLRARMLMYSSDATLTEATNKTNAPYLYSNLDSGGATGYWTLSAMNGGDFHAYFVDSNGYVTLDIINSSTKDPYSTTELGYRGVRPVITIQL